MAITLAVFCGFILAALAPWLHHYSRRSTGWLLALYPLAVAIYALSQSGAIADGNLVRESVAWAPSLGLMVSFALDGLSLLFVLLISGIGALVLIYTSGYMGDHPQLGRFYVFLLIFMASMLGLVLSDNVLALFVFWEGTSISSYLLIGFNHKSEKSRSSALQALLITGGGGLAMLVGLLILSTICGSWSISELLTQGDAVRTHELYVPLVVLILLGAFTKSAQFPFHFWLPNAMEAPTPVSAYLHSATMVKAGIYLMARLTPTLGGTELWTQTLTFVGGLTMLTSGILALLQTDLKRLLAYSTISALGTLTMLLGLGTTAAIKAFGVFILAHALYKGALFMVAGAIDHETGTRNVEQLSGLRRVMPITALVGGLAAISLAGAGPLISFIGKEMLFEAVLETENRRVLLIIAAVTGSALFVAVAAIVGIKPFFGAAKATPKDPHEAPPSLWLGPALLAALGVLFGLMPTVVGALVSSTASAISGREQTVKLALWHGFNEALAMSVASLVLGLLAYAAWATVRRTYARLEHALGWGPARWYDLGLLALNSTARVQTRVLQNGSLRSYVMMTIVTATALTGTTLLVREGLHPTIVWEDTRFYEAGLAALILMAAFAALRAYSRLAAIAALGVVGYCVALLYLFFGAPDLAMTQVLVDTLTVILFVLVFYHLPHFTRLSSTAAQARDAMIAIAFGALMTALVLTTNNVQFHPPISEYFAQQSVPKGHGHNIVNVILVDFRALDTLGEIVVLALAGIGVYSLLRLRLHPPQSATTSESTDGGDA